MFAEIQMAMGERGAAAQETDVVQLNAEALMLPKSQTATSLAFVSMV